MDKQREEVLKVLENPKILDKLVRDRIATGEFDSTLSQRSDENEGFKFVLEKVRRSYTNWQERVCEKRVFRPW